MTELRQKHVDWEFEGSIVEVKTGLAALRDLRDWILQLTYVILKNDPEDAYLVLSDSRIKLDSLIDEWERAIEVLKPYLGNRMFLVICGNEEVLWSSELIQPEKLKQLTAMCCKDSRKIVEKLPRPDFDAEVLKTLLNVWIVNEAKPSDWIAEDNLPFADDQEFPSQELLTITKLSEIAGCSYRTVDKALDFIGTAIERHGNKGFRLKYFPRRAWEQMEVLSSKSRSTMKFTDRSGRPRSAGSLMKRLVILTRPDIAVGGVSGAYRIFPELDITDSPRLNLTVHSSDGTVDMSFIRHLDPALRPWRKGDPPPSLAIHFLRRRPSYFRVDKEGVLWADPIECLLDLLEARLDYQALQFRKAIIPEGVS